MLEAARQRLAFWDIAPEQIRRLEESGEVFRTLQVVAPASGVVMLRMPGLEGMATRPGMELLHIADLSNLWLTVEVFDNQLPWLDVGSPATVTVSYFPGVTLSRPGALHRARGFGKDANASSSPSTCPTATVG